MMSSPDNCLKNRIMKLFNSDRFADIHFNVEGQRIPCHKSVIATASKTLENLCADGVGEVFVEDSVTSFTALLRYLYTDKVTITVENLYELMVTAKNYGISSLEDLCIKFRISQLNADNAFMILFQAVHFGQESLIKACLSVIDDEAEEALNSEGFLDVDERTLMTVLSRDTLKIKEIDLFLAIMRWSDAECQRRKLPITNKIKQEILSDIVRLIRFPIMTLEEFNSQVLPCGVLSHEDTSALFSHLCSTSSGKVSHFNSTLRRTPGYTFVVSRFQSMGSKWTYFGGYDKIAFTVDKNIHLLGVGLFAVKKTLENYHFTVYVLESPDQLLYRSTFETIKCDWNEDIFHFYFDRPVRLSRHSEYIISVKIKEGPASLCGCDGLKKIKKSLPGDDSITVTFHKAKDTSSRPTKTVRTNVSIGQIPELIFSL